MGVGCWYYTLSLLRSKQRRKAWETWQHERTVGLMGCRARGAAVGAGASGDTSSKLVQGSGWAAPHRAEHLAGCSLLGVRNKRR